MTSNAAIDGDGLVRRLLRRLGPESLPVMAPAPKFTPPGHIPAPAGPAMPPAAQPTGAFNLAPRPPQPEAFTPTQPKRGRRSMTGRQNELARILQALWEEQAHVILYTDRGRGKTSLANLVVELLRQGSVIVARHTCESGSTFDSIMRGLVRDLPHALLAVPGGASLPGCEEALPPGELRPRDIVALPSRLTCQRLVCVIDEFDRVTDVGTRTLLADAIKQLSDAAVPMAFLIVGVSENLEAILGQHPSIQRNLVAVPLPFLNDAEIVRLMEYGMAEAGFTLQPGVADQVASIVRGSPYMAQLAGLRLIQAAKRRGGTAVTEADFGDAVRQLIEEAPLPVLAAYAELTAAGTDSKVARAVHALAWLKQDVWGRIAVLPSIRDGVMAGTDMIGSDTWDHLLRSGFVRPAPGHAYRHTFADRGLMHHVLLLSALLHKAPASVTAPSLVSGGPHLATGG